MTTSPAPDVQMAEPPSPRDSTKPQEQERKYGGFTRFEIELEFVQCLANPHYLLHLATLTTNSTPATASNNPSSSNVTTSTSIPLLQSPPFIAYLAYLQYFRHPPYIKFLMYPGPTLKNLELLQNERFRREILSPEVVARMVGSVAG